MAIHSIVKMGTPSLFTPSLPVTKFSTAELYELITDLKETMHECNGVGIAAPQIGCNLRVFLFGFEHNPRYPTEKPVPLTVVINPVVEFLSTETLDGWEGCLSIPGLRGWVPRYQKLKYTAYDIEGRAIEDTLENFPARIVQHELDHLDGALYPKRIQNMSRFGFEDALPEFR